MRLKPGGLNDDQLLAPDRGETFGNVSTNVADRGWRQLDGVATLICVANRWTGGGYHASDVELTER